ncbi:hypothetical protein ACP4OV_003215 [Aristida adscensionis]
MASHMAADGGLRRLFEKPLPENPTLLEALSAWSHPRKPIDPSSITEIFGELHFHERQPEHAAAPQPEHSPAPPASLLPARTASWLDAAEAEKSKDDSSLDALLRPPKPASGVRRSASFCTKRSSASLLLCTEGLGCESTVDADDMLRDGDGDAEAAGAEAAVLLRRNDGGGVNVESGGAEGAEAGKEEKRRRPPSFPPPIRSLGRGGKASVRFRSVRAEGRFVLTEVVIPGNELLRASREGGRLRLQFANAAAGGGGGGVGADEDTQHGEVADEHVKDACIAAS